MRVRLSPVRIALVAGMLMLGGCSSPHTPAEKYSGFLKNYSELRETTSASGKPILRWVAPGFDVSKYDTLVYQPMSYYPVPKPSSQIGQRTLDQLLAYANQRLKASAAERINLVDHPGPHSLIFRGAITGVDSSREGLQFYEVVPVAMIVAGTQAATGHRTMNTRLYFEGEVIDAATGKPVIKVVRSGNGEDLANEHTPMTFDTLKQVIDDMATDASMFEVKR
ncbi:DUF3313 domain-containing protein [Shimwellia pseudoproteus]|uniref:DUF3313 domain-containing protein n=1 Tax=Shimwellia pseudoproteus TaxID=570012 RepID=UPI0018EC0204|nr:DUF3313 domain-containing protein [Shimwellia pseudoproteus]MBJ3816858.1 DUF3313 domain-containing protein [Shimwellia pseudoproteus]